MDTLTLLGQPAPDFELYDIEGSLHRLWDYRGRIVLLYFWSAECPWAERVDRALLPLLASWQDRVTLLVVAPNANEPLAMLRQVAADRQLPLVLHDHQQVVAGLYQAQTTPQCFLIDAEGILCYSGAFDDVTFRQRIATRPYVAQAITALFSGKMPDPAQTPAYGCAIVSILE